VARSKTGEAISPSRRTRRELAALDEFIADARRRNDLDEWRRGRAVRGYIAGRSVISLAGELAVARGAINRWLRWYEVEGAPGLRTGKAPGRAPLLTEEQRSKLAEMIEDGPLVAGYRSGVWTGPMIADLIDERFGVRYHNHHIPRLLNQLGFSIQRPRKRLARADVEAQARWLRTKLPAIKKKVHPGVPGNALRIFRKKYSSSRSP
jgi:transposase